MSDHCPFLNRSDCRCGQHLNLRTLDHAYDFCFDVYAACPVYLELLIERQRQTGDDAKPPVMERKPHVSPVVQVQVRRLVAERAIANQRPAIAHEYAQPAAKAA